MKPEFNQRYNTIAIYCICVVAACALIVAAIWNFKNVSGTLGMLLSLATPFVIGGVLAYILNPILNAIEGKVLIPLVGKRLSRRFIRAVSVILTYIFMLAVLSVFFRIVIPQIAESISSLAQQVPGWLTTAQRFINDIVADYNLRDIQPQLQSTIENLVTSFSTMLTKSIPQLLQATISVTTGLLNIIVGAIISVYILLDKERFFAQIKKLLYALMPKNVVDRVIKITHQSHEIFSGFISGKILDSFIIAILCFIGTSLLSMPYAMLISVIVGVTNVIPYFGPFIGAVPSILILLIADPIKAIWFALFVLLLQQLDGNVIGPKILGDSTGLSAFWVIFSITVFGSLLGLVGMFIGVPLFAVIYALVREFSEWRLAEKNMPTDTAAFASDNHAILKVKKERKITGK